MIAPLIQSQSQILYSVSKEDVPPQPAIETKAPSSSDQPRILYQCGDCDKLFKSLHLWQEHRKDSACLKPPSEADPESDQAEVHLPNHQLKTETEFEPEPDPEPDPDLLQKDETDMSLPEAQEEVQDPVTPAEFEEPDVAEDIPSDQMSNAIVSELCPLSASDTEDGTSRKRGVNKKTKPEPVLLCVDCGSSFGLVSELVAHRKTQHGLEEALHRCLVCGESFLNTTLFLYHRKQHRQQEEEKQAPATAVTVQSLMAVQEEVVEESIVEMSGEFYTLGKGTEDQGNGVASPAPTSNFTQAEMFMCTQCGAAFTKEAAFTAHRKEKHGLTEALHCCSQCGQDFMNTTQYLFHRRQHHPKPGTVASDDQGTAEATATPQAVPKSSKRVLLSPTLANESDSPQAKKSRPAISIASLSTLKENNGEASPVKEVSETDGAGADLPPPAKLLQDWARTPLPHVCPHCGKTFTRRIFLRAHVYSHTGEKLFTCKVCKKAFTNSQSLLRHSMTHMGNKPFTCEVCDKNFSQAATLKRHQRTHTSTQPRRKRGRKPVCTLDSEGAAHLFSCPHCPSRFITDEQLTHHKLLHTSHPFRCKVCTMAFKRRKELDLHSLSHQDKKPVPCPHCSTQFINQSVLEIHMQRCPTSEEEKSAGRGRGQGRGRCMGQIECDLCGHRCMTQEGLDLHRLSHTGQTPLKCPVTPCRRRFASSATLEEHVLAHCQGTLAKAKNRPRFRCQFCAKDFAYVSTFNVHMRTHTDERPFECTTCHKRFRQLPHLQDHERIHSGLRPFCCWVCGKSFSVAARLTEHARTHSGEKPYPCPRCPSAFRSRSNLDKHIRLHGEQPAEQAAQAQEVVEGAKVLTSLAATAEGNVGTVQTFYLLQGAEGTTETVMIPSDQIAAGASQVVILPSSVMGGQTIAVPTIAMDGGQITVVEGGQDSQHTIEFIVEETV